ncbi:immunoglobulin superfamily member 1-like [Emydura macquarii macquarii]|uniref:immunoglobulin superfamily member 1-like n=1 Tax=Emydura macquarii macquarii TaxID=1129001 RepID=UPI00352BB7B1
MRPTRFVSPPLNACLFVNPEGLYPKPSISVSPSGVIPVGGKVIIRCWHQQYRGMRFFLYKDGVENYPRYMDPAGLVAEFPILSVRREQRGNYTCRYSARTGDVAYSEPSDPVQIIVADERPGPASSLPPQPPARPPGSVPKLWRPADYTWGNVARLAIGTGVLLALALILAEAARQLGTGALVAALRSPHCPIMASGLIVLLLGCWLPGRSGVSAKGLYPKPSISISPSGVIPMGGNVIIRCWRHQYGGMRFILYKDGDGNPLNYTDPAGSVAEFTIRSVRREQRGNYTCSYSTKTLDVAYSEPSDPVQIIVAGESGLPTSPNPTSPVIAGVSAAAAILLLLFLLLMAFICFRKTQAKWLYPKPDISVSPSGVIPMGGIVTIRCWHHQFGGKRFHLYKDGVENYLRYTDPAGSEAEFPILRVRREQRGNYTCRYSPRTGDVAYSEPSDPVQIIVAGESGSPTSLNLPRPVTAGVSAAAAILLLLFLLLAFVCFRKTRANPYPKPSISLSPSGRIVPGMDVSITCHGPRQGVRFKLYRAGVAQWHEEPTGSTAEFRIANVQQRHGGTYTCTYESLTEPPIISLPSDPMELVVAGGTDPSQPGTTMTLPHPGSMGTGPPTW